MEFWLISESENERLRLPVPPSEFELNTGFNNTTVNINDAGEINLIGNKKLDSINLSSFFPNQVYSFCDYYDFPKPYECVNLIKKWQFSKKPIRLIITETDINHTVTIEDFSHKEKDGTRDVYFSLTLKEFRYLKVQSQEKQENTQKTTEGLKERPDNRVTPKEHTVKQGETLAFISKKYYNTTSKWTDIKKINAIKDEKKLRIGQVLKLP